MRLFRFYILIYLLLILISNIGFLNEKNNIQITAHRGDSLNYDENTLSAFKSAKEIGADWIELDVQETKDKKLVVTHDYDLKRILNVNKKVSSLTYKELIKLDKREDKIPLLEDVIKFAIDNDIKLNIELKGNKNDDGFVYNVLNLINKYDFTDKCVISSFKYKLLLEIEEKQSNIKTIYNISKNKDNILDYKVDGYSINKTIVNKDLVDLIHDNQKEIFVWTINNEEDIKKMIEINVDNIITDNVKLVKEIINE